MMSRVIILKVQVRMCLRETQEACQWMNQNMDQINAMGKQCQHMLFLPSTRYEVVRWEGYLFGWPPSTRVHRSLKRAHMQGCYVADKVIVRDRLNEIHHGMSHLDLRWPPGMWHPGTRQRLLPPKT